MPAKEDMLLSHQIAFVVASWILLSVYPQTSNPKSEQWSVGTNQVSDLSPFVVLQNTDEKAAAERVRIHLRRGLVKMLDNAQKRRELEPAAETAVVAELQKLKEVRLFPLLFVRKL